MRFLLSPRAVARRLLSPVNRAPHSILLGGSGGISRPQKRASWKCSRRPQVQSIFHGEAGRAVHRSVTCLQGGHGQGVCMSHAVSGINRSFGRWLLQMGQPGGFSEGGLRPSRRAAPHRCYDCLALRAIQPVYPDAAQGVEPPRCQILRSDPCAAHQRVTSERIDSEKHLLSDILTRFC